MGSFLQLRVEMKIWDLGICCRQKSLFAKGQVSRERRVKGKAAPERKPGEGLPLDRGGRDQPKG